MKILVVLLLAASASAVDLCIFFNTCNKNNNNGNDRSFETIPAVNVDSDWIEPGNGHSLNNNQLYHFPSGGQAMDWYDANSYCERKGGFLAEPKTRAEHNFLKSQAKSKGNNANWWLGLREAQDCRCRQGRGDFEASLDSRSLTNRGQAKSYVKSICPPTHALRCTGNTWKWAFSGQRLSGFTTWNGATGEPNGETEHCVTMWVKGDMNWGDWVCTVKQDGNHAFKPICQKEKFNDDDEDYGDYNYYDDIKSSTTTTTTTTRRTTTTTEPARPREDGGDLEQVAQCVDRDVIYNAPRQQILDNVRRVRQHQECRKKCAENSRCFFWSWQSRGNRCVLMAQVRRRNFRVARVGIVSGTMHGVCRSEVIDKPLEPIEVKPKDHCVEYEAAYAIPKRLRAEFNKGFKDNVETPDECKVLCENTSGCNYWTWKTKAGVKRCIFKRGSQYRLKSRKGAVSGSVLGACRNAKLNQMQECECVKVRNNNRNKNRRTSTTTESPEYDDYDDYDDGDISGLIDVRIVNNDGSLANLVTCGEGEVRRCNIGGKTNEPIIEEEPEEEIDEDTEICGDFNIKYNGGGQISRQNNVPSADVCRAFCIQNSECKFFSFTRNGRCLLIRSSGFTPVVSTGAVSGSVRGACRNVALSRLTRCKCDNLDGDSLDYYEDEYVDLTDLVDVRSRVRESPCFEGEQGFSCKAGNESPILRTGFGQSQDSVSFGRIQFST